HKQDPFVGPPPFPYINFTQEICLDVEYAHAMAPGANLLLFEADDPSRPNLFAGVDWARQQLGVSVVSLSWGSSVELPGDGALDSFFTTPMGHNGVTFVTASGDSAAPGFGYPAHSPNVLTVGGTSLALDSSNNYGSEIGWSNSGGGLSLYV